MNVFLSILFFFFLHYLLPDRLNKLSHLHPDTILDSVINNSTSIQTLYSKRNSGGNQPKFSLLLLPQMQYIGQIHSFNSCFFRPYLDLVTKSSRIFIVLSKQCVDNHLCFCFDSHIGVLTLFYLTSCFTYIYFSVLHLLLPVFPLCPFPLPSVSMNHNIETAFHNNSLFLIHLCFLPRYLKFQTQLHSSSFAVT